MVFIGLTSWQGAPFNLVSVKVFLPHFAFSDANGNGTAIFSVVFGSNRPAVV